MKLDKIKADIDALLEEHKENWMDFMFSDMPGVCKAFKEKQIYSAMLIMAAINAKCHTTKNPIVSSKSEGYDLIFTWKYTNQYYLHLSIDIPWEGQIHYEVNTFEDGDPEGPMKYGEWRYKDFSRVDGSEVSDFAELIESATEKDIENEARTTTETI